MLTIGSLCTGAAGLDLAVGDVLGELEPAWVAEVDRDASRVLSYRVGAPNLGDITAVDWTRVEPVDVLAAGYPCTDLSNAGRRAGIEGAHSGIWRNVADAIRHLRPRLVVLENVAAHLARGFGRVVGDLAAVGYDTQWLCLPASDVGAPHRRDRVFIVASPAGAGSERVEPAGDASRVSATYVRGNPTLLGALLPTPQASDASGGRRVNAVDERGRIVRASGESYGVPLASAVQFADRWAQYGPAIARWEAITGRPAPDPTVTGKRGGRRLSGRFVEWLMDWPDGWVTDLVDNTAALRICGNGVVRRQGATAIAELSGASAPAAKSRTGASSPPHGGHHDH